MNLRLNCPQPRPPQSSLLQILPGTRFEPRKSYRNSSRFALKLVSCIDNESTNVRILNREQQQLLYFLRFTCTLPSRFFQLCPSLSPSFSLIALGHYFLARNLFDRAIIDGVTIATTKTPWPQTRFKDPRHFSRFGFTMRHTRGLDSSRCVSQRLARALR